MGSDVPQTLQIFVSGTRCAIPFFVTCGTKSTQNITAYDEFKRLAVSWN